jgi:hypothetical protein
MTARQHPAPTPRRPAAPESGYAMLLVFLMAAMIAIALYAELPRIAFEAQRAKEQLLIERGEQYKRAIQVFVRKMNRYPASIEELENTNNIRFLRKRYVDPMTGKDKWRLIHINGGVLTDSIIQKNQPGQGQQPQANTNTFIAEGPILGANNDPSQQQQINPALRRRASDDRPVALPDAPAPPPPDAGDDSSNGDNAITDNNVGNTAPTTPAAVPGMAPGRITQPGMYPPGTYPGQPGYNPANPTQPFGMSGTMPNQTSNPGQNTSPDSGSSVYVAPSLGQTSSPSTASPTGVPGQTGFPGQPGGFPGQPGGFPGQPGGFPGQPGGFPGQAGGFPGQPGGFPGRPGVFSGQPQGGFGQPAQMSGFGGGTDPTTQNGGTAAGMNNNFGLTSPSQMQPQTGVPGMGGTQVGGGIAGVASESKGPSIKTYKERQKYNEWEFVYDQSKDRGLAGVRGNGGVPGTPAAQMGSMPAGMNPQQPGMGPGGPGGPGTVSGGLFSPTSGFGQTSPQPTQPQPQPQPQQPQN